MLGLNRTGGTFRHEDCCCASAASCLRWEPSCSWSASARGGRPAVALLQGPAGLFTAAGLRAAGDDARARVRRLAARRIRQRAPALPADPGRAEDGDQRLHRRPRTRTSTSTTVWISAASCAPACSTCRSLGSAAGRRAPPTITQQVAKNFLLTNEVVVPAQDQGSAARDEDRAHLSRRKRSSSSISTKSISASAPTAWPRRRCSISTSRCTSSPIAEAAYLAALPKGPNN